MTIHNGNRIRYREPGENVTQLFERMTANMTREQREANQGEIIGAMKARIYELLPARVSLHTVDPREISVVDISSRVLGNFFTDYVRPRISYLRRYTEENLRYVFHLELRYEDRPRAR